MNPNDVRSEVKLAYGRAARAVTSGGNASCCGGASGTTDPICGGLYSAAEQAQVPADAARASLGCGNPTALIDLRAGEVVLDLGSGGGIDVLLSAQRVGPTGRVFGLDMTPEMIDLAEKNRAAAGATNVEFLRGTLEEIPLADASVDVVISNCVINLAADKGAVLREAFRVLRSGGRFAVSDVVLARELPQASSRSTASWTGCIGGALVADLYLALLRTAGFVDVGLEPTRVYDRDDLGQLLPGAAGADLDAAAGTMMSAFVRGRKPAQ